MSEIITTIFELSVNLLQGVMFVTFCNKFLEPKYDKKINLIAYISTIIVMFGVITVQNYFVISFAYSEVILFCAVMLPYAIIFHKGKVYMRIAVPLFEYVICMCISLGLSYFSSAIFGFQHNNIFGQNTLIYRIVMVLVINLLDILVFFLIHNIFKNKIRLKSYTDILFFLILPIISIAVLFLTYLIATDGKTSDLYRIFLALISFAMFAVTVLVLNAMVKVTKSNEIKMQNMIMKKEQEMYISEIENGSEYIREIAKIKHDMKNKIYCIGEMLSTNNIKEAKTVCDSISQELKSAPEIFNTKNIHLNSILNVTYKKAKEKGVDIMVNAQTLFKDVDGIDLITVIGNLCDNAIEALQKQEKKQLQLLLFRRSGYYMVAVKNNISDSVLENNPNLLSDKDNTVFHGHGINSVRNILKKYNGDIRLFEEDGFFVVEAYFEVPTTTQN